jgi:phage virion morphogenesis protein
MSEFADLSSITDALLATLKPTERRRLATRIARDLLQANQRRIAAQKEPDGTPFTPRKPRLRKPSSRKRLRPKKPSPMFRKLRTSKWLQQKSSPEGATIAFKGSADHIATVHHFGLTDTINPRRGIRYRYPARRLLGIASQDLPRITDAVISHMARHA